jgi:hypothetical protein
LDDLLAVYIVPFVRATAREIYATLHLVCDEDVTLSACTHEYGRDVEAILKANCIRYFTMQFEYVPSPGPVHECVYALNRKRRGHNLPEPVKASTTIDVPPTME